MTRRGSDDRLEGRTGAHRLPELEVAGVVEGRTPGVLADLQDRGEGPHLLQRGLVGGVTRAGEVAENQDGEELLVLVTGPAFVALAPGGDLEVVEDADLTALGDPHRVEDAGTAAGTDVVRSDVVLRHGVELRGPPVGPALWWPVIPSRAFTSLLAKHLLWCVGSSPRMSMTSAPIARSLAMKASVLSMTYSPA